MKRWGKRLLDLLYPPKCVFCRRLLEDEEMEICNRCRIHLPIRRDFLDAGADVSRCVAAFYYRMTCVNRSCGLNLKGWNSTRIVTLRCWHRRFRRGFQRMPTMRLHGFPSAVDGGAAAVTIRQVSWQKRLPASWESRCSPRYGRSVITRRSPQWPAHPSGGKM